MTALGLLGLMVIAGTSTASAAPPQTSTWTFTDAGVAANCGTFNVTAQYEGQLTETVFFDNNGAPIRVQSHGIARGTMTNSATGFTVKDAPSVHNGFFNFTTGTATSVGVDFHVTVPGAGVVILQAGRIVFDGSGPPVFVAGPHLGPPPVQVATICAALDH